MATPSSEGNRSAGYSSLPAAAWSAVAWLWLAGGSNYLTRTTLTTMRGSIVQDIPMSDAQFGLLTSAFLWLYAIFGPFGGFLADRYSRRLVVIWSIIAWSSVTLVTTQVRTFESFLALRALLGISQAFYIPAAVALIIDYHLGPTRALASGIHLTGMVFGSMIGGLGGWLAEQHSWRYAYTFIGLPNLGLAVLLYFFLRDPPREHLTKAVGGSRFPEIRLGDALRSLGRPGPFYYLVACQAVQGAVSWIIIGWVPTLMREQFKLGQGAAGFSSLGVLYGSQIVGLLIGGFWSDRWSPTNPRARIIIPAVAILLTSPIFWLTGWFPFMFFSLLSLSMWGLAMGFFGANTMPIVCLVVDVRYRATAVGMLNACTAIFGGVALYGVGALRDAKINVNLILTLTGLGVFLCGFFLWLVNTSLKQSELNPSPASA